MAKTYSYEIGNNLYINLTNRCSNACTFCVRNGKDSYYGNSLWLDSEPSYEDVINSIDFTKKYDEIVFCGFGEPTYRIDLVNKLAKHFKSLGYKTRMNTNGQGNLINGKSIVKSMVGLIDSINVSLNMPDKVSYQKICLSKYGEEAFESVIAFAKECIDNGINAYFSIVDVIGNEMVEKCKALSKELNVPLKIREFIQDS